MQGFLACFAGDLEPVFIIADEHGRLGVFVAAFGLKIGLGDDGEFEQIFVALGAEHFEGGVILHADSCACVRVTLWGETEGFLVTALVRFVQLIFVNDYQLQDGGILVGLGFSGFRGPFLCHIALTP